MGSKNLVICDRETEYASRLADYLGGKKELALQVKLCSSPEQLEAICRETPVDILLADDGIMFTEGELAGIPKVMRLSPYLRRQKGRYARFSVISRETISILI